MSDFISTLLNMSLVGTYCILVVLHLRLFLRKAPKVFTYILWGVVFLRLALPIFPEAPVSLVPDAVRSNSLSSYLTSADNAENYLAFTGVIGSDSSLTQEVKAIANSPGNTASAPQTNSKVSVSQEGSDSGALTGPTSQLSAKQLHWASGSAALFFCPHTTSSRISSCAVA